MSSTFTAHVHISICSLSPFFSSLSPSSLTCLPPLSSHLSPFLLNLLPPLASSHYTLSLPLPDKPMLCVRFRMNWSVTRSWWLHLKPLLVGRTNSSVVSLLVCRNRYHIRFALYCFVCVIRPSQLGCLGSLVAEYSYREQSVVSLNPTQGSSFSSEK